MFDAYTEAKNRKLPKWLLAGLAVAVVGHAVVLGGVLVGNLWQVDDLGYPGDSSAPVLAMTITLPRGTATRAGRRGRLLRSEQTQHRLVPGLFQKTPHDRAHVSVETGGNNEVDEIGGHGVGGECPNPPCDASCPNPPCQVCAIPPCIATCDNPPCGQPPKIEAKVKRPPQVLEALRLTGDPRVSPDNTDRLRIRRDGSDRTDTVLEVCIDANGDVASTRIRKSSGYRGYDRKIQSQARSWTYRAYRIGGRPTPMCSLVRIIYLQAER